AFRTRLARSDFHVHLIEYAILPGIAIFIDISVVAKLFPKLLYATLVTVRSGSDVVVISDPHPVPQRAEFTGDFVGEHLRRFAGGLSSTLDLLPVLISPRQKPCIETHHPLPACNRIAGNRGIGMANVRSRIDVIDGSRDVELVRHNLV